MPKRSFLIVNPVSGTSSPEKVKALMERLVTAGVNPELLATTCAEDAGRFASRICAEEADPLILVAGGDGTVNGVVNGLLPGRATLAVIPLGTSNVLARELKIASVEDAVARVTRGVRKAVSVGEMSWDGGALRFILMAGIGVDGAVVEGVRLPEKKAFGKGAYVLSALRTLRTWDREEIAVRGAGRSLSCHSVIVCNAGRYAGDFVLAPEADLFSPGFQVLCVKGGRLDYFRLALRLFSGTASRSRSLTSFHADEVEVGGEKCIQLDGDYCRRAPVKIRSLPDFMQLVV
ncbi:YegS/Rv2252/BmrU family lipid kinase [Geomonas sp. RF6]|uniref:diacylglycerol/lipid kinase family protein n=1 Tax=Geomonas sp. RF6 TaxID=2897342 RepID=UPI001E65C95A|nr:YegS/Rv2252/BmrU family lipid kinase [Geomonas sp. RF6]UFS71500.1 YegS/Rv2252/BmrU family lipid kinase [Geomonas sp. RF6]